MAAPAATPETGRAAVRDFTSGAAGAYEVSFDVRTAYDFVLSLSIGEGAENDLLPADRRWLAEARATLPAELRSEVSALFGDEETKALGAHLVAAIVGWPDARDAAGVVRAVESASPRRLVRTLVEETVSGSEELNQHLWPALAGEEAAMAALEAGLPEKVAPAVMGLVREPERSVARLGALLSAWQERYVAIEEHVARMLQADAERQRVAADAPAPDVVERSTGGIRLLADPTVRRVILAPAYVVRPYNYLFSADDWRLFCYPIGDEALDSRDDSVPPGAVVRLYRALGDETRLRILRLLRDHDLYLTELAQELELSKPTVKHHLSLLRAAGLVTMTEEGGLTYYSLRRERLAEAGLQLERYLG